MAISSLPQPIVAEILQSYADVLRLGSLRVNGSLISWDASAGRLPEERLEDFGMALGKALRAAPEVGQLVDEVLVQGTAYWLCKALSINYALAEVLQLVTRRVGTVCSIESWNGKGSYHRAEYNVELQPGPKLRVGISWVGKGNLVSCDPSTAEKQVKGTISRVETEFSLPPERGFAPEYHVQMELCKTQPALQFSVFGYGTEVEEMGSSCERLILEAPLRRSLPQKELQREFEELSDGGDEQEQLCEHQPAALLMPPHLRAHAHSTKFGNPQRPCKKQLAEHTDARVQLRQPNRQLSRISACSETSLGGTSGAIVPRCDNLDRSPSHGLSSHSAPILAERSPIGIAKIIMAL